MSRPRFLFDHDVNEHIVDALRRAEPLIDILRARDAGLAARSDAEVLEFAAGEGRLVISHDVNTMSAAAYERIAAAQPMAGLLLARQTLPVSIVVDDLVLIWSASQAEEWRGHVVFLPL